MHSYLYVGSCRDLDNFDERQRQIYVEDLGEPLESAGSPALPKKSGCRLVAMTLASVATFVAGCAVLAALRSDSQEQKKEGSTLQAYAMASASPYGMEVATPYGTELAAASTQPADGMAQGMSTAQATMPAQAAMPEQSAVFAQPSVPAQPMQLPVVTQPAENTAAYGIDVPAVPQSAAAIPAGPAVATPVQRAAVPAAPALPAAAAPAEPVASVAPAAPLVPATPLPATPAPTTAAPTKPPLKTPVIPPPQKCSWANEDCHETKCCSNIECDYKFENCQGFKCYKKDNFDGGFAGCKPGPPGGWTGQLLGGTIAPREVPKAPADTETQGTSLFCFSVVMWNMPPPQGWQNSEKELANNWKSQGLGIMHCDEHMIVDGMPAPRSGWGSTSNIDVFIKYWQQVRDDGRYKKHDWVAKVDTDAVFFPNRLKMHLESYRAPKGTRAFVLNNAYRFKFLGALEVMTKEALDLYFENADRCSSGEGGHSGGEDYYMKVCLQGIGVDIITDTTLLFDKYAAQDGCNDGWAAAFHFWKKVSSWNYCHTEALNAQKAHDNQWNAQHPQT
mmetsp:Transcript_70390/g.177429  ORF Transcript_70390/g.177429 Transcript_70390/m.177429 type:complete len:561 (-) Transcript_70390:253-1935(-)|eukprot:CAMPEP_0115296480 /NCGR_PEP_ID=MMETSP0270-20121206/67252_1 /TAXON_ID=71861 /ORGANISM="Scrippsiella trochoidea, Strain CCMP3099" /LENGTH=560 /DNA_ID=CAMNT_0002714103 /DNA_START=53 /DNA_END=1735 /DNA_ORIENTATION=-